MVTPLLSDALAPAGPCATWTWPEPSPAAFAWPTAATLTSCERILQVPVAPWSAWCPPARFAVSRRSRPGSAPGRHLPPPMALASLLAGHPHGPCSPPSRTMRPSALRSVLASRVPWLLTTVLSRLSALRALISTWPPSARMRPPLCASVDRALVHLQVEQAVAVEVRLMPGLRPGPRRSCAWITPSLLTRAPSRRCCRLRWLAGCRHCLRLRRVAGELVVAGEEVPVGQVRVEATRPPTLTWADLPRPRRWD